MGIADWALKLARRVMVYALVAAVVATGLFAVATLPQA